MSYRSQKHRKRIIRVTLKKKHETTNQNYLNSYHVKLIKMSILKIWLAKEVANTKSNLKSIPGNFQG